VRISDLIALVMDVRGVLDVEVRDDTGYRVDVWITPEPGWNWAALVSRVQARLEDYRPAALWFKYRQAPCPDCVLWDLIAKLAVTEEKMPSKYGTVKGKDRRNVFAAEPLPAPEPTLDPGDPFYYWTVRVGVHPRWVADGFQLTDERAKDWVAEDLGYAYEHEVSAAVVEAPDPAAIRAEQNGTETDGHKPRMCKCGEAVDGDCCSCNPETED
jgi:hypothetical protein